MVNYMQKRKTSHNPNQLELALFPSSNSENPQSNDENEVSKLRRENNDKSKSHSADKRENKDNSTEIENRPNIKNQNRLNDLFLPFTYEEILEKIGDNQSRLPDLIVPVNQFEKLIIQVLQDINSAGYLLFLYGISGVGKYATFCRKFL